MKNKSNALTVQEQDTESLHCKEDMGERKLKQSSDETVRD